MRHKLHKLIPAALVLLAVFVGLTAFRAVQKTADSDDGFNCPVVEAPISIVTAGPVAEEAWSVFQHSGNIASGSGSQRYRLAGTFFLMEESGGAEDRKRLAIIDDIQDDEQYIVSEREDFQGYEVLRIYQDQLILRRDAKEIVLNLSFSGISQSADASANSTSGEEDEVQYPSSNFGKQVGENRWVLERESLLSYYKELLEDPERIASIYMSLKGDYVDEELAGFRVEREGEGDFFTAVGLSDGDVIRKVNSMDMISQQRGEYFLSEFMQDRLGAVVIDIERGGKEEKLIYFLR